MSAQEQGVIASVHRLGPVDLYVENRGSGPAVVFVHGYTTTSRFWRHQASAVAADHHAVSVDLRGHGRSSKPVGATYTIAAFADDLLALLGELGIGESVLVGLSMGGAIVLRVTLEHPERVRGLVLADTTSNGVGQDVGAEHVLARIRQVGVQAAGAEIIEASFAPTASRELVDWAKQEVRVTPRHVAEEAIVSLSDFDVEARLGEIGCPTLVIVGDQDRITPPTLAEVLRAGITDARLVTVPHSAHFPMLEQPEAVNSALKHFLAALP